MQELAKKHMLRGMQYSWTGLALQEIEAGNKAAIIFGLGILVVYMTLAALYESFVLPFIILLSVPMAVLGALTEFRCVVSLTTCIARLAWSC